MTKIIIGRRNARDHSDYRTSPAVYQGYFQYRQAQAQLEHEALWELEDSWRTMAAADEAQFKASYQQYYWQDEGEHDIERYFKDSRTHQLNVNLFARDGAGLSELETELAKLRLGHLTIFDYWLDVQQQPVKNWGDAEQRVAQLWTKGRVTEQAQVDQYFLYWGIDRMSWPEKEQPNVFKPEELIWQNVIFMLLSVWQYDYLDHSPANFAAFMGRQKAQFSRNVAGYLRCVADGYLER